MRTYTLNLRNAEGEEITVDLRLTIMGQKNLQKKYKDNSAVASTIFTAVADPGKIVDVFGEALNFNGNKNTVKSGAELYDLLVDNGYEGADSFMEVLAGIAHESGIINEKQANFIVGKAKESEENRYKDDEGKAETKN